VRVKNFDGICEHFQGLVQVFCCSDGSKGRKYSESEIKSAEKRLRSNGSIFKNSPLLNSMGEIFIEIGGVMEFLIDNYGLSDMKNWEKSIESDHKALLRLLLMLDHVIKPCVKVINHDISENLKAVNAERLKAREQGQNHKNKNKKGCSVSSSSVLSLSATPAVQDQPQVAEEAEVEVQHEQMVEQEEEQEKEEEKEEELLPLSLIIQNIPDTCCLTNTTATISTSDITSISTTTTTATTTTLLKESSTSSFSMDDGDDDTSSSDDGDDDDTSSSDDDDDD